MDKMKDLKNYSIVFDNYLKSFSHKEKVGPLNFTIRKGKVTIIIGRSGSGKSVILNSIMGNYSRYRGSITIEGYRRKSFKGYKINNEIGFYTQMDFLSYDIKLSTYLFQISKVFGLNKKFASKRIEYLLELFELKEHIEKKIKDFSWGMKNRLNLVLSLLKDPNLIILDEPGANLDSLWRKKIKEILLNYKNENKTIILVVHNIDEVFDIADDLLLIDHGQIIYQSEINNLKLYFKNKLFFKSNIATHENYQQFKDTLIKSGFVIFEEDLQNKTLEIGVLKKDNDKINFLVAWLIKYNIYLEEIINIPMNYESIYNSLLYSNDIKELPFYFKSISKNSRIKLNNILAKNMRFNKKMISRSNVVKKKPNKNDVSYEPEYVENQIHIDSKLLDESKNKVLNAMWLKESINLLSFYFSNKNDMPDELTNKLEILIRHKLKDNFLTKIEENILYLSLKIFLHGSFNQKDEKLFLSLKKLSNTPVNKLSKKFRTTTKININLIKNHSKIQEKENKLFW